MIKKVLKHIVQEEPLLFELSSPGKCGYQLPELDVPAIDPGTALGKENVRAGADCGLGLRVHPQMAWAKLKTLTEGAALATKQLWG